MIYIMIYIIFVMYYIIAYMRIWQQIHPTFEKVGFLCW
jgi:hypothetical protein